MQDQRYHELQQQMFELREQQQLQNKSNEPPPFDPDDVPISELTKEHHAQDMKVLSSLRSSHPQSWHGSAEGENRDWKEWTAQF